MNIKLRHAGSSDLKEMQTLFEQTIKNICKHDYDPDQIEAWVSSINDKERWKSKLMNQYFLVAEIDLKIVGFGSLENGNYLDFLYVHKDYMRKGIASLLFEKLKKESIQLGHAKLNADVSKTARPFFEAKRFRVIKENNITIGSVEIVNYHMSQ